MRAFLIAAFLLALQSVSIAGALDHALLQADFEKIARAADGRVGVCAQDSAGVTCISKGQRFSLQSVMKLIVGAAVMEAVDRRDWKLEEQVLIRKSDLSLNVQPLAQLVGSGEYRTTVGDLVRRAIVDSDSAATDILLAKLGGPVTVQDFLRRKKIPGLRIDRNERDLQTETVGLRWRPEYVDAKVLDQAIDAVPASLRNAAWAKYQHDERDTSTPEAMASFLLRLSKGDLLSPESTKYLLNIMRQTVTFPDRLKAGVSAGWSLGHKTGSSGTWQDLTVATNDVGILTAPDGGEVAIAVFIADSKATAAARAAITANLAAATIKRYRPVAAAQAGSSNSLHRSAAFRSRLSKETNLQYLSLEHRRSR